LVCNVKNRPGPLGPSAPAVRAEAGGEELDRENAATRPGIARDSIQLDSKSRYNKSSKVSTLVIELSSEVNEPT
jgi:hypothetical protein